MSLTTTTSLAPSSLWINSTNPVIATGSLFRSSVPIDSGTPQQLFRLEKP
jgi:hypothetical protein